MTAVRTLLTVFVAVALLGASLPAVEDARTTRTDARLEATAGQLSDAAASLVAHDDPLDRCGAGAGRTVTVSLPEGGFTDARASYLAVGGTHHDTAPSVITYRVAGRPPRHLDVGVHFVTGDDPLVLTPGRHVLRLTLVRTPDGPGVCVRRRSVSRATGTNVQIRERTQSGA